MEWTALRDLVAVSDTGSLSAAARKLGVSQPTIGRRIEQLESELNTILFNRTNKGLDLTQTGSQVLAYAQRMSDEAMAIERIAHGASQVLEGTVRITTTDMMGNVWLPSKLPEFYQRYPNMRLEILIDNRNLDLIRREADLAIRFARPQQLDLVTRKSIDFYYGLYASKDYLKKNGYPQSFRDLKQHYFVSYDETIFQISHLKRVEKLVGRNQILHRSSSVSGVLEAIKQGVGIGITGCYFSDMENTLERIFPSRFNVSFTAWLVTHADLYKSARIKAVFDFLYEKLEEESILFAGDD
jgi:DNA-binding transcriptional LysR family regulator